MNAKHNGQTAGRVAHGMDSAQWDDTPTARPASATERMPETDDTPESVRALGDAIRTERDATKRAALWASCPAGRLDTLATYVCGIPAAPAHYAFPESDGTARFVSLDALVPDTLDTLTGAEYDRHGRPGVSERLTVSALLWDATQDVAPTWDAMTREIVRVWLTVPESVARGTVNYSAVARAAGLVSGNARAPQSMRDAIAHAIAHAVRTVETRAAEMLAESGERTGGVRDVTKRTVSRDRLTPDQVYRLTYAEDYGTSWRDTRATARDLTSGYPWASPTQTVTADPRALPMVVDQVARTYVPRTAECEPISPEVRATLYGEHARTSQARFRTVVGDAMRESVRTREGWHATIGRDRFVPSAPVAPEEDTPAAPVASGRNALLRAFGSRVA